MRTRADKIQELKLGTDVLELDEAGYLIDPTKWTPAFAQFVANGEKITMTGLHWDVIEFMRAYSDEHGVSADVRHVLDYLKSRLGVDKRDAKATLYVLFPAGHVQQTCKMAGMRQPRAWSTG